MPFPPICGSYWFEQLWVCSGVGGPRSGHEGEGKKQSPMRGFTLVYHFQALLGIPFTSWSPWVLRTEPCIRNEVLNDLGQDFHSIRAALRQL